MRCSILDTAKLESSAGHCVASRLRYNLAVGLRAVRMNEMISHSQEQAAVSVTVSDHPARKATPATGLDACLEGGGGMGALMRAYDWSRNPLGPVASWPQSLRTAVSMMLASKFPMLVLWGEEY